MSSTRKLWILLTGLLVISFGVPERVVSESGDTIYTRAAIDEGYWYARSHDFMQQPIVELLVWMRVPGDTIFSIGALALMYFVARLWIWPRTEHELAGSAPRLDRPLPEAEPAPAE